MRRNGTSAASLPQKIPAVNPQIAGGPKAGWNTGFRPATVGGAPQRNTDHDMVLGKWGPRQSHGSGFRRIRIPPSVRRQPTALCS